MINLRFNDLIDVIEYLRKTYNVSQKELITGIIDPSTYSKLKAKKISLNIEDAYKLLSRFNASWLDIEDLVFFTDARIRNIHFRFFYLFQQQPLPIKEVESLYEEIITLDLSNGEVKRLYLMIRSLYSNLSPKIPAIDPKEMTIIFNEIDQTPLLTSTDYRLIGDLTEHFSLPQLIKISARILSEDIHDIQLGARIYKDYIPLCLTNIIEIFINNQYYAEVPNLLDMLTNVCITTGNFHFRILAHYFTFKLQYLEETDTYKQKQIFLKWEHWIKSLLIVNSDMAEIPVLKEDFDYLKKHNKPKKEIMELYVNG